MSKAPRTIEELSAWQVHGQEPVLDPDLEIVDAHHHMWDRPPQRYDMAEVLADMHSGHNVRQTVFVECSSMYRAEGPEHLKPVGETEHVARSATQAEETGFRPCAGIVGAADLTLGERVRETLEAHVEAGKGRFRGVRQQAQYDGELGSMARRAPPEGLLREPAFHAGARELARLGLSVDIYLYFTQLDDVAHLARAVPEATIVLNHAGTPLGIGRFAGKRDEVFAEWARGIRSLAQCHNITVKLGGLGMTLCGFGFEAMAAPPRLEALAEAWRPYIETCIAAFGAERAMFESNFPVDKQSCGYAALWNAFKLISTGASDSERRALFAETAKRVYRLSP